MSPTVFRHGAFRFYFFSREETQLHVHVQRPEGEAKYWLEPRISLAQNLGLSRRQLCEAQLLVESHADEIRSAWWKHFGG